MVISTLLFALVVGVFLPSLHNNFVNYDDDLYICDNPHVRHGITWSGFCWALTSLAGGSWHPLTWFSIMLDCQLFGLRPGGHHLTSLLLHAASTIVLYLLFRRMTGASWRSAVVAALFALHPLHVESVAWASERKDVLSGLFFLLALLAYERYVREKQSPKAEAGESGSSSSCRSQAPDGNAWRYYGLTFAFFICGLMSKPSVVTLPLILFLLDWWPLGRLKTPVTLPQVLVLLKEKLPFLLFAVLAGVLTLHAQQDFDAVSSLSELPLRFRVANAIVSYSYYLVQTAWPVNLAAFYPYPKNLSLWRIGSAALLLAAVSAMAVLSRRRRPYLAFGWIWYLVLLLLTIGLIQVGVQARADRYTYLPLIGVFVLLTWGACDLTARWHSRTGILVGGAAVLIGGCIVLTREQIGHWNDGETLFRHALAVTENNSVVRNNLGDALIRKGRLDEAIPYLEEAIRLAPHFANARMNLGAVLGRTGRPDEAVGLLRESLKLKPDSAKAHSHLGIVYARQQRLDEALAEFREALRLAPDYVVARINLGAVLGQKGQLDEAILQLQEGARLAPADPVLHCNLADALALKGRVAEAVAHYQLALQINPASIEAREHLRVAQARLAASPLEEDSRPNH